MIDFQQDLFSGQLRNMGFVCLAKGKIDERVAQHLNMNKSYCFYIIVGNAGGGFFTFYRSSGHNSLDEWTRWGFSSLAKRIQADVIFPFDGPPYTDFQALALASGYFFRSPIKLLIHKNYGLWTGFRGIFLFRDIPQWILGIDMLNDDEQNTHSLYEDFAQSKNKTPCKTVSLHSPCMDCLKKPCLASCPARAFRLNKPYAVDKCHEYLSSDTGRKDCMKNGCKARLSCPVGTQYKYAKNVVRFFMTQFQKDYD